MTSVKLDLFIRLLPMRGRAWSCDVIMSECLVPLGTLLHMTPGLDITRDLKLNGNSNCPKVLRKDREGLRIDLPVTISLFDRLELKIKTLLFCLTYNRSLCQTALHIFLFIILNSYKGDAYIYVSLTNMYLPRTKCASFQAVSR